MRGQDIVRLVALAAIWGASFIFLRTLAPVLGPVVTATSRVVIAGVALVGYFRIVGFDADLRRYWREFAIVGLVNSALPFLLFAFAAVHATVATTGPVGTVGHARAGHALRAADLGRRTRSA